MGMPRGPTRQADEMADRYRGRPGCSVLWSATGHRGPGAGGGANSNRPQQRPARSVAAA